MKPKTQIWKVRVTGEVLATATATRQHKVGDRVLTFSREPVYLQGEKLPHKISTDSYLQIEAVDTVPEGGEVIDLKAERVQEA
jgi:hypothetical protein